MNQPFFGVCLIYFDNVFFSLLINPKAPTTLAELTSVPLRASLMVMTGGEVLWRRYFPKPQEANE